MTNITTSKTDILIIGSGAAGMATAIECAKSHQVVIISKTKLQSGATTWAQGGIAAATHPQDSWQTHANDTILAGADLCNPTMVDFTISQGASIIKWLQQLGMPFCMDDLAKNQISLCIEGGHSKRRIAHCKRCHRQSINQYT